MVHKETSIAEKILKLFPDKNIVLNKNFNGRKQDQQMFVYFNGRKEDQQMFVGKEQKKSENSCTTKIFKKFSEIIRNAID